jgi:hypothetical protein
MTPLTGKQVGKTDQKEDEKHVKESLRILQTMGEENE